MNKKILAVILSSIIIGGCSSTVELPQETNTSKRVPAWYLEHADTGSEIKAWYKPWSKDGFFYAVAEDVSPSMEMALRKSTLKAKSKIADRVTGELTNRTTIKYTESGPPDQPIGESQAQDLLVNLISETALQSYGITKKEIMYNPEMRNYRAFVMLKISRSDVDKISNAYNQHKQMKIHSQFAGQDLGQVAKELLKQ